ncbi:hypothetical protein EYZ11_005447 [Aspergillus tanneri]|uniref:Uncharacterized protein n=1 Tax=Aspergillus tanneri TaxID=1220188 RepID=A0A4S3JHY7_9EURO|nr:uncharacterized protein ATNIH1004_006958 [Aspergillus tanneri]KAA8645539.1 hypothetical protein ATNIH1004_006958 [Aspergillus tanneri]THC95089.1 hypothetical protein EYZ11_005447 [Aspergillus tanneri]
MSRAFCSIRSLFFNRGRQVIAPQINTSDINRTRNSKKNMLTTVRNDGLAIIHDLNMIESNTCLEDDNLVWLFTA